MAEMVEGPSLSRSQFDQHSKVHSSTLGKRFGSWEDALKAAGLSNRFVDATMPYEKDEVSAAIKRIGSEISPKPLTLKEFSARSGIDGGPVRRLFGSWKAALHEAGHVQSALARRYTDEQCFENMLALWSHYGRAPHHDEANCYPSEVGPKAYVRRWGTWRKALAAFVDRVSADPDQSISPAPNAAESLLTSKSADARSPDQGPRDVPLALRYFILKRDRFRCVTCGRSPATHPSLHLHVDHILPWVLGGRTIADNLRALCSDCNLGKGASHASEA